ncbi:hypothetical protein MtrunA17_Chr5g0398641 [Medicago truncatula]|nr:AT-hook motif nuclear-localized protein 8-like [Medicago truncatula]RHN53697.1 hypothetical protein MtrunA17_Chr5g0398641 [Medicago truncatula]
MLEVCDNNSGCKRMGNFKVSLVGPDLRPLGGVVANKLIAASSVKVTVGSFTLDVKKASSNNLKIGPSSVPSSQIAASGTPIGATLQGPSYESSGDNQNSPFSQRLGSYNNASQPFPTTAMYQKSLARQIQ